MRHVVRKRAKPSAVVAGLVVALVAAVSVGAPPSPATARTSGGRVQLSPPVRGIDTRVAGTRVTTVALGSSVLDLFVVDAAQPGTATVHPCTAAPGAAPTLAFETGEVVYTKVLLNDACLTSTTPVHVVVDVLGSLSDTPESGRLQYVPVASPVVVLDAPQRRGEAELVPVELGTAPPAARAAVVLIEAIDPAAPGFARVDRCSGHQPKADMTWRNDRSVGVSYIDLTSGPTCLWMRGEARVRLTVIGHLSIDGPDDTRLPPTLSAPLVPSPPPGLRAVTPARLLDTRSGLGIASPRRLVAGETFELPIATATDTTTAVALNVTVTEPEAEGYLTVFPCDQQRPKASNLNFVAGETVPNLVNVKVSVTDTVCFFAQRSTHLVVDLTGTFETGGGAGAEPVAPVRLLDTRLPVGVPSAAKVTGGDVVVLQMAGRGGVPVTGSSAITMNVTVTEPERDGFVTVYPCDRERPTASNLNFVAGQTVPNLVSVRLSPTGTVCLFTQQTTHLVADLAAWYAIDRDDGYRAVAPDRVLDTRDGTGAPPAKVAAGGVVTLQVAGRGGVPAGGATAVAMNVTVVDADDEGFVTVYPCGTGRPEASNLNHAAGETVPNLVTVRLAADGTVCLFAQRTVHLVADVAGYYTDTAELLHVPTLG